MHYGRAFLPYWDDLRTDGHGEGIYTRYVVRSEVSSFYIEWRAEYSGTGGMANFEAVFFDIDPTLATIYGTTTDGGTSSTEGVQD